MGWLTWLVSQWDDVEAIIRTRQRGPWFYVIYESKLVELDLPSPSQGLSP
jgi:hypothetical protein